MLYITKSENITSLNKAIINFAERGVSIDDNERFVKKAVFYTAPPKTRAEMIYDLRNAFGEAADSPNVDVYEKIPTQVLSVVTDRARKLHVQTMIDTGIGYAVTVGSTVAGALTYGFLGAAGGLALGGAIALAKIGHTLRQKDHLRDSVISLVP